jgi:hypothetical protein
MQIQKITIGITLYGVTIYFKYLAYVRKGYAYVKYTVYGEALGTNTFLPIGKQVKYIINSTPYITYQEIPMIVYHQYHNVEILEEKKMAVLLRVFERKMDDLGIKMYKEDGVTINYVKQEPIIDWDPKTTILVRDKTPKQDHVRALIDVSDQLKDHNPRSDVTITFYLRGKYQDGVSLGINPTGFRGDYQTHENPFYIEQINTFMEYKYDENSLIFFNDTVGYFEYDIITGGIKSVLHQGFVNELDRQFMLNYPNAKPGELDIYVMVLEPDINYRSIIYN